MQIPGALLVGLLLAFQSSSADQTNEVRSNLGQVAAVEPTLTVIDEGGKSHTVTATDVSHLSRRRVKTKVNQDEAEFEGVSLVDLLKSVGVGFGKELKGPRAADIAVCEAADGYRVSFALLEIDPETADMKALLADRRDGALLGEKEGPFRLVVPDDKRPIRWIRMLRTIRVMNLKDVPLDNLSSAKTQPHSN